MRSFWIIALGLLIFVGCGDSGPRVVTVSGRLTRAGRAVPDLTVSFMPAGGRPSTGRADKDGRFTLAYTHEQSGAVVGTHSVSVSYSPKDPGEEMEIQSGAKKLPPETAAVLEKYGKPETSPLKIEINDPVSDLEVKLD